MGTDILPGHVYVDGEFVNGPSLTDHVGEATIKPSFYSARSAKDPVVLTDEFLVRDTVADQYRKVTLATLQALMVGPGGVVQTSYAEYTANSNLTAVIPVDDTIPQNTEGTEILSVPITPKFSTSRVLVQFQGQFAISNVNNGIAALFRDAAAPSLATQHVTQDIADFSKSWSFQYLDSPATTSAITYRIRVGPGSAATLRLNGLTISRRFGGTSRATLIVQEIKS
jgi:hypothetical protein